MMGLGQLLMALWLTSLLSTGSCFFGGTTMAGSEQLEAYIGYKCQVFLTIQAHKPGLSLLLTGWQYRYVRRGESGF